MSALRVGDALRVISATTPAVIDGDLVAALDLSSDVLRRVESTLSSAKGRIVEEQAERYRGTESLRVNLGCGISLLEGWINIDIDVGDIRCDLRDGIPLDTGAVRFVYASHVLEHFDREDGQQLLLEIRRVLAPGGVLRLVVPDLELCLRAYANAEAAFFYARERHWPYARFARTPLEHFLEYAGAGASPLEEIGHRYGYDFETLSVVLAECGFQDIVRSQYMRSGWEELRVDNFSHAATMTTADGKHFSLFLEARPV
jgi:SAM-dependent methyltransferase